MTQMGTGRRSLIALRIFSIFLVIDAVAIGFYLAPESIINFFSYPWAVAVGTLLASWFRLGIFPFHSIHRWAAQSIGPSAALLFSISQVLMGIHFIPSDLFASDMTSPVRDVVFGLLVFHLVWMGLLSLGEKRPMMMLTHGLLLLTGLSLILNSDIKVAFSLEGPWPWLMGLFAIFGLFTDELHNLKNDTLAPFEHAQVGLLLRWKPLHFFTQALLFTFIAMLFLFPFWVMWMPALSMVYSSRPVLLPPQKLFWALTAFAFGALALSASLLQLWRRFNTEAPVERMVLPDGAVKPNLWQWHFSDYGRCACLSLDSVSSIFRRFCDTRFRIGHRICCWRSPISYLEPHITARA